MDTSEKQIGKEIHLTEAEVSTAIKPLKTGKALGEDGIRPEMLKTMNNFGVCWLTRVFQVAWKAREVPKQWQSSALIPIHKMKTRRECTNYRGISLFSLPEKVYAKCLKKRCREIVKPQLQNAQCGFCSGRFTVDQIFTL